MYRVFDAEKKQWITKDVYLTPSGKLFKIKKSLFGWIKIPLELSQDRYIYHEDIQLYDNKNNLIFIGDYIRARVAEDKEEIGLVSYAHELSAYVILCVDSDTFYTLGSETTKYIPVIGNVFDGYKEEKKDGKQALSRSEE